MNTNLGARLHGDRDQAHRVDLEIELLLVLRKEGRNQPRLKKGNSFKYKITALLT